MKRSGTPRHFQTIACHHFEPFLAQARAIGRKKNRAVAVGHLQGSDKQLLKILLYVKHFSAMRTRERRRIENDHVEFFAFARESREDAYDVVGNEFVIVRAQTVEREIFLSARERFF